MRREHLKNIPFLGGELSISGVLFFVHTTANTPILGLVVVLKACQLCFYQHELWILHISNIDEQNSYYSSKAASS